MRHFLYQCCDWTCRIARNTEVCRHFRSLDPVEGGRNLSPRRSKETCVQSSSAINHMQNLFLHACAENRLKNDLTGAWNLHVLFDFFESSSYRQLTASVMRRIWSEFLEETSKKLVNTLWILTLSRVKGCFHRNTKFLIKNSNY